MIELCMPVDIHVEMIDYVIFLSMNDVFVRT